MRRFLVAATLMLFLLPAFAPHAAASAGKALVVRVDSNGDDLCYIRTNHHHGTAFEYWIESNGLTRKVFESQGYQGTYPHLPYGATLLVNPEGVLDPAEDALADAGYTVSGRAQDSRTDLQIDDDPYPGFASSDTKINPADPLSWALWVTTCQL